VSSEDALLVHLSVILLGVTVVTGETLLGVGDVKASIGGTLEGSKNTATSGGGLGTNIKEGTERAAVIIDLLNEVPVVVEES